MKDDPVVAGNRDGGADARAPLVVVPESDLPDDDAPDCRTCSETLSTETARGTLCRKKPEPSSVRRLNAVVDCVCYDKCVQECGTYCAGSTQTDLCQNCVFDRCSVPIAACIADTRAP